MIEADRKRIIEDTLRASNYLDENADVLADAIVSALERPVRSQRDELQQEVTTRLRSARFRAMLAYARTLRRELARTAPPASAAPGDRGRGPGG